MIRLGETLPQLPDSFWEFTNLKKSIVSLMEVLTKQVQGLPIGKSTDNLTPMITEKKERLLKTFLEFRLFNRKLEINRFNIEQIYQIFTSIQLIQQCSEIVIKMERVLSF